jgi:uncharacterized protein YndB with AHSA1/START domain
MAKKKDSPKKAKKNIKSAKTKPAKKVKVSKPAKKSPPKKVSKPVKSSKKPSKPTKSAPKKVVKVVKKISKPDVKKVTKPVAKPAKVIKKPIAKVEIVKSKDPKKSLKEEKSVKLAVKKVEKDIIKPAKEKKPRGKGGRKPKKKDGEDDGEPEIVHDELIEQLIQSTKKKKAGPKVPKILKTFVNPMTSLTVAPDSNGKKGGSIPKKEPKGKFELEYVIRTSAGILYEFITTPSGLSEWFADDVNIRDGIFTFFWDGSEQKAKLLGFKEEKFIRLSWIDKPDGMYFEFRIEKDELTGDVSLIIIDFADEAADMQTSKLLWDSQVNKLLGVLGSN